MKLKPLLLRGALGVLLAGSTVGVAVVTTAAPAQADCIQIENQLELYNDRIRRAEEWFVKGVNFAAAGQFVQARDAFQQSDHWYYAARTLQAC